MISSVAGKNGNPLASAYSASKHAIEGLSESLRREMMLFGIDVIIVAPGAVKTPIWSKADEVDISAYRNSPYFPALQRVRQFMLHLGEIGLPPEKIAARIADVLASANPQGSLRAHARPDAAPDYGGAAEANGRQDHRQALGAVAAGLIEQARGWNGFFTEFPPRAAQPAVSVALNMTVPLHFYDMPRFPAAASVSWSPPAKTQGSAGSSLRTTHGARAKSRPIRRRRRRGLASVGIWRLLAVAAPHLAALAVMLQTETDFSSRAGFLLSWGILNFFWIALLRRPALSGALSLTLVVVLVLLSRLKHDIVQMTANFVDLMVIDRDTAAFLFTIFPHLRWSVIGAGARSSFP